MRIVKLVALAVVVEEFFVFGEAQIRHYILRLLLLKTATGLIFCLMDKLCSCQEY
jgi:hypothetical protein